MPRFRTGECDAVHMSAAAPAHAHVADHEDVSVLLFGRADESTRDVRVDAKDGERHVAVNEMLIRPTEQER